MFLYNNYVRYKLNLKKIGEEKFVGLSNDTYIKELKKFIASLGSQKGKILNIGPCSEEINFLKAENFFKYSTKLLNRLNKDSNFKTILVARMLGQTFKSRSFQFEIRENRILPNFLGEAVNSSYFDELMRETNGKKILENFDYLKLCKNKIRLGKNIFFSHEFCDENYEALFLENNLLCSTHIPWLGYRHSKSKEKLQFLSKLKNPIGIKVGPELDIRELKEIIYSLNSLNEEGKILLIFRLGREHINKKLDAILNTLVEEKINFTSICDPMHGNNLRSGSKKYRLINDILYEVGEFKRICSLNNVYCAGIHLEFVNENIVECVDNPDDNQNYLTNCDPCLNTKQLDLVLSRFFYENN